MLPFRLILPLIVKRIPISFNRNVFTKVPSTIFNKITLPVNSQSAKKVYSTGNGDDSDSDVEYNRLIDSQVIDLIQNNGFDIKETLYPNSEDQLIMEMKNCKSVEELFNLYNRSENILLPFHNIQMVLSIWDFHKNNDKRFCHEIGAELEFESGTLKVFEKLIERIEKSISEFSADELTCSVLYLNKINISKNSPLLAKITNHCLNGLKEKTLDFSYSALSRLTVILNANKDFFPFFTYPILIPNIIEKMENCNSAENLVLITVCLKNVYWYLNKNILQQYKAKLEELDNEGLFKSGNPRIILKIASFLNSIYWSNTNTKLIRKLLLQLDVDQIAMDHEMNLLFRLLQSQLEPSEMIKKCTEKANEFRKEADEISPTLLQCGVFNMLPEFRAGLIQNVNEFIKDHNNKILTTDSILSFFRVLRQSKVSDINLCNQFWDMVLQKIKADPIEMESYKLIHHSHRYMYFNNNLGGTYRHYNFENFITELIINELQYGFSQFVPTKFAQLSSFVIAYGSDQSNRKVPDFIIEKLIAMKDQINLYDCLQLSRGVQVALELRYRRGIPHDFARQLLELENIINDIVERTLRNENLTISDVNLIIRGFNNRKASRRTPIFQSAIRKLKTLDYELNSRIIRDLTFNLTTSRYRLPKLCDDFLNYIVENEDYVTGDTVEKIIHCCYFLGHDVSNNLKALKVSSKIVERDFEFMSGLSIVNSCLALSFYQILPEDLTNRVFCIDFIKRLEDEIKMCYSKATYPQKVLNKVMQLNRTVCLDFPDYNVPWFQQNYLEAQTTKISPNQRFQEEFMEYLRQIFKDHHLIEINHNTAYGYRIDFLLNFNKNGQLVDKIQPNNIQKKLAIILTNADSFCENDPNCLSGFEMLRQRHLEILGFHVARINFNEWNSMFMNVTGAKRNFVENAIGIK